MPDDAPLQQTLKNLQDLRPGLKHYAFAITSLDVTGVPVWSVTQWQADGEMINGIGYGDTDLRAQVGAWAELLEQTASHGGVNALPQRTASYDELRTEVGDDAEVVDPRGLRLPAGTAWTPDRPCSWVRVERLAPDDEPGAGRPAWTLVESVATHHYDLSGPAKADPLYTPISNGNGAGDTPARAFCHGLLELVQRDGNSAGYRAVDRGIRLDVGGVTHPGCRELLDRLDAAGIEVFVKLADVNLGMANVYVVGHERDPSAAPHPLVLSACGEAAHPDRDQALHKALLEFCASRVRKVFTHGPLEPMAHLFPDGYLDAFRANPATVEEGRSFEAVRELAHRDPADMMAYLNDTLFLVNETRDFATLPTVDPAAVDTVPKLLSVVRERFAAEGLPVYRAVYFEGPTAAAGKAVVPPMEVETMTYRRIGPRNLDRLTQRGFDFVGYGDPPAGADPVLLPGGARSAWLHPDRWDARVGDLYALYREPEVHAIALHEARNAEGDGAAAGSRPAAGGVA